jgi:hypothetical protein
MPQKFDWGDESRWPFSGRKHVFVAGALGIVGRHLFGGEWTGREYSAVWRDPNQAKLADELPEKWGRDAAVILLRELCQIDVLARDLTPELWAKARDAQAGLVAFRREAQPRRAKTEAYLLDAAAAGELVGAVIGYDGGFTAIPAERWHMEEAPKWIRDGEVDQRITHLSGHSLSVTMKPLFFENAGLAALKVAATETLPELRYVPPYMRLMFAAIDKLGMTAERQPKVAEIQAELAALSGKNGLPEIKPTLAKSAATLMREIEAQAGSAWYHSQNHRNG